MVPVICASGTTALGGHAELGFELAHPFCVLLGFSCARRPWWGANNYQKRQIGIECSPLGTLNDFLKWLPA